MASFHPTAVTLEIVGLESNTQGRSCDMHATCGCLVKEDVVLRLRKVQVVVEGMEESAIAAYHVSDGVDSCRVGFLKRHLVKHSKQYEGALVQVTEVYSGLSESPTKRRLFHRNIGCCQCAIITPLPKESRMEKRVVEDSDDSDLSPKRIKAERV